MSVVTAEQESLKASVSDEIGSMDGAILSEPTAAMPRPPADAGRGKPRKNRGRKPLLLAFLFLVVIAGATAATLYYLHASRFESTDDAFVEGRVIPISPQVPARVLAVNADDNVLVHKGDVLVELDPTDYQVALEQAKASESAMQGKLEQAKSQVTSAKAAVQEAQAEVNVAQANAANAASDYQRYQMLSGKTPGAVSRQQMDSAQAGQRGSSAQVEEAKAKLAEATSEIATAQATVRAAGAEVDKAAADRHRAEVNLSYCTIKAPEDGRMTRKNVEPGSYVQTGQSLFAIVPAEVWIVANFKETQLDHMRPGQPVTISIDAYPGHDFTGKVNSIQSGTGSRFSLIPAENATGNFVHVVQRVPVKIELDPGQTNDVNHPLVPGMSVEPEVEIAK
jgi:membrane fusion protein (multidrug efflux system)